MSEENFPGGCSPYDPYSRSKLGWINPIEVTDSLSDEAIASYMSSDSGQAYKLTYNPHEYFLVSNHNLNWPLNSSWEETFPGKGLLIWHIDTTAAGCYAEHKIVDLESADGLWDSIDTDHRVRNDSTGQDSIDAFPTNLGFYRCFFNNNTKQAFNNSTNPTTAGYIYDSQHNKWKQTVLTGKAVMDIQGAGGDTMWADFYNSTTWWGPDTVFLSSDFVVETGWRLLILPGTVIKFDTTDAQNGWNDRTRCELIVQGTLEAWGSEGDSVCFRSASANPTDSAWYGIEVTSTGSLDLHYCKIQDALAGISWTSSGSYEASSAKITHCQTGIRVDNSVTAGIKYCALENNQTGLRIKTNGVANVDSCSIQGGNFNVSVDSSGNVVLNHCSMVENNFGIWLNRSGCATLNWTTIIGSGGLGGGSDTAVVVNSGAIARLNNCNIRKAKCGMRLISTGRTKSVGCTFDSTEVGIRFSNYASDSVISCIFKNNKTAGILTLNDSLLDSNCTFVDSTQSHNGAKGIDCQANCSMKNSFFHGYQYGITIGSGKRSSLSPTIENCGFYNIGDIGISSSNSNPTIQKCCFKGSYGDACIKVSGGNPYIMQCYMASDSEQIPIGILFTGNAKGTIRRTTIWDYNYCAIEIIGNTTNPVPNFGDSASIGCNWFEEPDSGEYYIWSSSDSLILAKSNYWEEEDTNNIRSDIVSDSIRPVDISPVLTKCYTCYPYYADLCSKLTPSDPIFNPCKIAVTPDEEKHLIYFISQNYPNPFNPVTIIKYNLPEFCHVVIDIYNVLGQKVKTLVDEDQAAGLQNVFWDGKDTKGRSVSSGIYFYKIKAGDYEESKQMILLR